MKKPDIVKLRKAIATLIYDAGDNFGIDLLGTGLTETETGLIIHFDHETHLEDYSVEIVINEPIYNSVGLETEEND